MTLQDTRRRQGQLPLESYAAIGDGWTVALSGADGGVDWWCAPRLDDEPVLDRLLDRDGAHFLIRPRGRFTAERRYRPASNILVTEFATNEGRVRLSEGMPVDPAGEPARQIIRRIEGLEGRVEMRVELRPAAGRSCRLAAVPPVDLTPGPRGTPTAGLCLEAGQSCTLTLSMDGTPAPDDAPDCLRRADEAWREWTEGLRMEGPYADLVLRHALALKLLCAPSGAVPAAATTSLPEKMGSERNWDFRYVWIRDAAYAVEALVEVGAVEDAVRTFEWLIARISAHGPSVAFDLDGALAPMDRELDLPGYRDSRPVHVGNLATRQRQHGVFGDMMQAAHRLARAGWRPGPEVAVALVGLADESMEAWRAPDAGIWELSERRLYANSRLSCWQALARAVDLADAGLLPAGRREHWAATRDLVEAWIEECCWSEARQAYVAWPGSEVIDASLALMARSGFGPPHRVEATLAAIDGELGCSLFHHRMSGVQDSEGCFLACSFWVIEAKARLGRLGEAAASFEALVAALGGVGILPEMAEAGSGRWLGNMPQGLTHIALIQAAAAISRGPGPEEPLARTPR